MKKVLAIAAVPALFAAGLLTGKIISDKKHDDEAGDFFDAVIRDQILKEDSGDVQSTFDEMYTLTTTPRTETRTRMVTKTGIDEYGNEYEYEEEEEYEVTILDVYLTKETIRKQLWDYYVVKEQNVYANLSWIEKERKLKKWCETLYCQDVLKDIDKYDNIIRVYGAKLKKDDLYDVQEKLQKCKDDYEDRKTGAEKVGGFCEKYIGEMILYKIQNEMQEIKKDSSRTLMPEDLIQSIIAKDFINM